MALYDNVLPPTAYFRPPVYRGGNALIDKFGKSTVLGDIAAVGLPVLGTVGGALLGGPAGAALGGEAGKLGAQLLAQGAGRRDDDSAAEAQTSVGKMMGLAAVGGQAASLATPFMGAGSLTKKAPTTTASILPPVPGARSGFDPASFKPPTTASILPPAPGEKTQTLPDMNALWQSDDAQRLFGGKKPASSLLFR